MSIAAPTLFVILLAAALPAVVAPQAADVPIHDDAAILRSITQQCTALHAAAKLVPVAKLTAERAARPRCRLELPALRREKLTPAQVCAVAQRATWVVGTFYHCRECTEWHFSGATGYAIAASGALATCAHVVAPDPDSKDEFLAAADPDGKVHPVLEVLAADLRTDVCIVRVDLGPAPKEGPAPSVAALALNVATRPGDEVFCYGHPQHHFGFFTQGSIARFAVQPPTVDVLSPEGDAAPEPAPAPAADGPPVVGMEITAEFAAGSSGSPVLDDLGNAVGHANSTEAVFWDDADPSATNHQMTLHIATVARDILALIEPLPPAKPAADGKH